MIKLPAPSAILSDPCASRWLKESLLSALKRDPLDAMNDAEFLAHVLRQEGLKKLER